ncbi:MAG: SDR family NAD(P)-dependent oxidoreductase [Acidimicrobiales bacterium]
MAVVAGGGAGLGRACALDLAAAGCALALCDIDAEALAACAAAAREAGAEVLEQVLDVRQAWDLDAFFDAVDERFGRVDVLVNVVGGTFRAAFTDISENGREALVRTNFTWVVRATQLAARRMIASKRGGSIVMLTSIEAHRAAPGFAVYGAMKAALAHLARTLAVELGEHSIRVNCVAPDFVPTSGMADITGVDAPNAPEPADAVTIPLGRKGTGRDIGNCVLFLASDLSSYVTGTTLHPDGGALAAAGWMHWPDGGWVLRPPDQVFGAGSAAPEPEPEGGIEP